MQKDDVQDVLAVGFEVAPIMPSPDGGLEGAHLDAQRPDAPRLCEAGPCIRYHHLTVQLDAEAPIGQSLTSDGAVVGLPEAQPFHKEHHHYCYADVGIMHDIGGMPILECNHWLPKDPSVVSLDDMKRQTFLASAKGKAYTAELETWKAEMATAPEPLSGSVDDDLQAWVSMFMRDGDRIEVFGAAGDKVSTLSDEQRDGFTRDWMGNLGPGSYRAWITRPVSVADSHASASASASRERVAFKDIEVP